MPQVYGLRFGTEGRRAHVSAYRTSEIAGFRMDPKLRSLNSSFSVGRIRSTWMVTAWFRRRRRRLLLLLLILMLLLLLVPLLLLLFVAHDCLRKLITTATASSCTPRTTTITDGAEIS